MADLLLKSPIKYEPHQVNRWVLRFPTDISIQTWQLKSVTAPSNDITTSEISFLNTSVDVASKYKWGEMSVVVIDYIAPSTGQGLVEWLRLHAESVSGRMGYAVGYKKTISLERLDPTGVVVQEWSLINCMLKGKVDFGSNGLDYSGTGVSELSFTLQPERCILLY